MNVKLVLGITLAVFFAYLLVRRFLEYNASLAAYRRMMHDLLTNEKYQAKGRYD